MSVVTRKVVFRANGGSSIGLGHIVRCLAMAEMIDRYFNCAFIINSSAPNIANMIPKQYEFFPINCGDRVEEQRELSMILDSSDIFVADGYEFDETYQAAIKQIVHKYVAIDDKAQQSFVADVIINQGQLSALPEYRIAGHTILYSGLDYCLLRRPFLQAATCKRKLAKIESAFICMGGADPLNLTAKVLQACLNSGFLKRIVVVTGSAFSHSKNLESLIRDQALRVLHFHDIPAAELAAAIRSCEIAITTASSIALEVVAVKAALICGISVDNQHAIYSQLTEAGACIGIPDWNTVPVKSLTEAISRLEDLSVANNLISRQAEIIDGKSADRIVGIFQKLVAWT